MRNKEAQTRIVHAMLNRRYTAEHTTIQICLLSFNARQYTIPLILTTLVKVGTSLLNIGHCVNWHLFLSTATPLYLFNIKIFYGLGLIFKLTLLLLHSTHTEKFNLCQIEFLSKKASRIAPGLMSDTSCIHFNKIKDFYESNFLVTLDYILGCRFDVVCSSIL